MKKKIIMSETNFIELVNNLAESDDCTGREECNKSHSYDLKLDCCNCWAKRLGEIIKYC